MNKYARAEIVVCQLEELYPDPKIPLLHSDAFTLLVAVLLSAQCTDARVNLVTPILFARAHTPAEMMNVPVAEIQTIIRPCGLSNRKAQAIRDLSEMITHKHAGQVPDSFPDLEALPGVGHKTASVVMVQAFDVPAFPVDTHIFRLARKWKLSSGKNVVAVEHDLKRLFPKDKWGHLHLATVLYGREYCPARGCTPLCPICAEVLA